MSTSMCIYIHTHLVLDRYTFKALLHPIQGVSHTLHFAVQPVEEQGLQSTHPMTTQYNAQAL